MAKNSKKEKVQFTAQLVPSGVVDIFNELKANTKDENTKKLITSAALFERMVIAYTNPGSSSVGNNILNIENERLASENQALTIELAELKAGNLDPIEFSKKLDQYRDHDRLTNEAALDYVIERVSSLEKENLELSKKKFELINAQFVCEFQDEVSILAKKARPLILRDGYLKNDDGANYPNLLANLCVKNFLLQYYDKELK